MNTKLSRPALSSMACSCNILNCCTRTVLVCRDPARRRLWEVACSWRAKLTDLTSSLQVDNTTFRTPNMWQTLTFPLKKRNKRSCTMEGGSRTGKPWKTYLHAVHAGDGFFMMLLLFTTDSFRWGLCFSSAQPPCEEELKEANLLW